jgi:predicted metal-dependent hydrolase
MSLSTESRFPDPDIAYRTLIEAHRGLSDEDSAALNTRLVLLLANHIGDLAVLTEAVQLAKATLQPESKETGTGLQP